MIIDYLEGDYKTLITTLFVVCFTWIVVIVAMLIDPLFRRKKSQRIRRSNQFRGVQKNHQQSNLLFCFDGLCFPV